MSAKNVTDWTQNDVAKWLREAGHEKFVDLFLDHEIDGKVLLTLKEDDLRSKGMNIKKIGDVKRVYISIKQLQRDNLAVLFELGYVDLFPSSNFYSHQKHEVRKQFLNIQSVSSIVITLNVSAGASEHSLSYY